MSADAENTAQPDAPAEDDMKRKFRDALAAKKGRHGEDHLDAGGKAKGQAHGPVEAKRTFRRKTG